MKTLLLFVALCLAFINPAFAEATAKQDIAAGRKLLDEDRDFEAIKRFDHALKFEPNSREALYWRGVTRVQNGHPAKAIEDLSRYLDRSPREPNARFWRGYAYGQLNRHAEANEDFSAALGRSEALHEDVRYDCLVYRGLNRNALGKLEEARSDLDAAVILNPQNPEGWAGRARVRRAQGDEAGAQSDSQRAGEIDPELGTSLEAHETFQFSRVVYWSVIGIICVAVLFSALPLFRMITLLLRADKK